MKLGEVIPKYQAYRNQLVDEKRDIYERLKEAQDKADNTGDENWKEKAAELQGMLDEKDEQFEKYNDILSQLREQWCNAANAENAKAQSDPETGMAATYGKIMTTVARMCAGDKVPYIDEKKVMEYDKDMYMMAKQTQMMMAAMKEKRKEYKSLWDEEGGEYDPKGAADNTEAQGNLPDIPEACESSSEVSVEV